MPPPAAGRDFVALSHPGLTGAADPISHLFAVLRPRAVAIGQVVGDGAEAFARFAGHPLAFCIVMCGRGVVERGEHDICIAAHGDFILLPGAAKFTVAGITPEARVLVGRLECNCVDPSLLSALLPPVLHVQGSVRQEWLASVIEEEASWEPAGSLVMRDRLLEVMLVDALRKAAAGRAPPGLLQGMGDARLVPALYGIHAQLDHPWTVAELAGLTDLRRSAFHVRFTRRLGASPMDYLLSWRMLVARELLRSWVRDGGPGGRRQGRVAGSEVALHGTTIREVARRVGYSGTASFIRAFHRHVGQTPGQFAQSNSGRPGWHS